MMQILKIGKIRKCLLAKWSTFRNDNWINSWISWWVNAIYLTESLHYMGLSLSWLPGPDCHFLKSNLMVSTRAEICHSRAFKFPGKFPGKLEKSGKIPVSRESKNPGKSTPLMTNDIRPRLPKRIARRNNLREALKSNGFCRKNPLQIIH